MNMSDAKPSGLRPPTKIGRPCCTIPPRPAVPPSPSRSTMREMDHLWETHGRRLSEAGLRRGSDNSVILTEDTDSFIIGDRVWVGGTKPGSIAYIGETKFAPGEWAGVVLDEPIGKNDGSVAGCRYFQCEPKRGVFARLTRLTRQPLLDSSASSYIEKTPTTPLTPPGIGIGKSTLNKTISPSLNASTTSLASTASQKELRIGERVIVSSSQGSKAGILRYLGPTDFAPGEWCGVELNEPHGKNDGSVDGKRYFECRPKHGLFASVNKVSRSPSNKKSICMVQKPTGAALNSSLRRTSSRESLGSVSSMASVTSRTATGPRRTGFYASTPARTTLQETLKEKQQEIEMLRKERDLERERVTKAASQADQAEHSVLTIKLEYDKYREDMQRAVNEAEVALTKLLEEKNALAQQLDEEKRKCEDLLFRFEEESVNKDDIQKKKTEQSVINTLNENRIKDLEKQLSEERERVVQLEQESVKLFETEEELARLRNELSAATAQANVEKEDVSKLHETLEKTKTDLEKHSHEKSVKEEEYARRVEDLVEKLNEKERELTLLKNVESSLKNDLEETKRSLQEKCSVIENTRKEYEMDMIRLNEELNRAKENTECVVRENEKDKELLNSRHRKIIEDQENFLKKTLKDLAADTRKQLEMQRISVEFLKEESIKDVQKLSRLFEQQSNTSDSKLNEISLKLKERESENERLLAELSIERDLCTRKKQELEVTAREIEDLSTKLKLSEKKNLTFSKQIEQFKNITDDNTKVIQEKQKLEDDIALLKTLSTNTSAEVDRLNEELKQKDIVLDDLRKSAAAQIEELSKRFQSEIEDKSKYIDDISADVSHKSLLLGNLEREIAELKSIIISKNEEIKDLLDKTSELQYTLSLSEDTKKNLESELHGFETNVEILNQKLARADEKLFQATAQKDKLELDIANLVSNSTNSSEQLQKFNQDLRSKEKEVDEYREKAFQLENSLTLNEGKVHSMEQELTTSTKLIKELETELESIKSQLSNEKVLKEQIANDMVQHQTREQELLALVEKNKTMEDDFKEKISQVSHLTAELCQVQEELSNVKKDYQGLHATYNDEKLKLQTQVDELEKSIALASEDVKTLQKAKSKLEADQSAHRWSIEELSEKLKSEMNERTKLQLTYEQNAAELKQTQEILIKAQAEKEALVAEKEAIAKDCDQSLNNMRANIEELKRNLNVATETIQTREKDIIKIKSDCDLNAKKVEELNGIIEAFKQVQIEKDAQVKTMQETLTAKEKDIIDMLGEKSSLGQGIESLKERIQHTEAELSAKNDLIENMKVQIEDLKSSQANTIAKLRTELESKERECSVYVGQNFNAEKEKESLQNIIDTQNNSLDAKEATINELREKIKDLQETLNVKTEICQPPKNDVIVTMQNELNKLQKENERLSRDKAASEKSSKEREEKIQTLLSSLKDKEKESEMNIQNLTERLNILRDESAQLVEMKNRLEHENKQILAKWSEASDELKSSKGNLKKNYNAAGGDVNQHKEGSDHSVLKLQEEYEMAKSQIDFLNSVIVDMQRKNEALICKVEVLEMGIPANEADDYSRNTLEKRTAAPRMFCDICDQFDLHETEDCPRQAQDFQEQNRETKSPKKPSVERPYCENCEVFGHNTGDCDDTETF